MISCLKWDDLIQVNKGECRRFTSVTFKWHYSNYGAGVSMATIVVAYIRSHAFNKVLCTLFSIHCHRRAYNAAELTFLASKSCTIGKWNKFDVPIGGMTSNPSHSKKRKRGIQGHKVTSSTTRATRKHYHHHFEMNHQSAISALSENCL